jgi:hypothetical protein
MRLCVVSSKECWEDGDDLWWSTGGFPAQMAAIGSLFDELTLIVVGRERGVGGATLPSEARVVPLHRRSGAGRRRKLELIHHLGYYLRTIASGMSHADAVHIPLPGDIPFLGMIVAMALRKRVLVRYCGAWERTGQTTLMNTMTKRWMRHFAPGPHIMLVTGEGKAPPAPAMDWIFATALSGDELEQSLPPLDRALNDPPRLISVARLSKEKGTAVLLDAIAQLRREGATPLPIVTIVGDGPERGRLETRAAKVGCRELVTFKGQLTRPELAAQFAQADVCVQPSLTEGFSKAWLDAMAYGLPVLSSDVGAAPFVIGRPGERGWLVPPGDVPALARAIRRIIAGPIEWPQMRRRCRCYVEGRTLEVWAQEIGSVCARRWGWRMEGGKLRP